MTKEEYGERIRAIESKARNLKYKVACEYATSHNKVVMGDMVKGYNGWILVDETRVRYGSGHQPTCVYHGVRHTAKGAPFKSGERDAVWQCNVLEHKAND